MRVDGSTDQVGCSVAGKKLDCLVEILDGMVKFTHRLIGLSSARERNGGIAIECDCLVEIFDSAAVLPVLKAGYAAPDVKIGVFRIEVDGMGTF